MSVRLASVARYLVVSNRSASDLLLWGIVAHLIGDWVLQNDWIARNKHTFSGEAATVHAAVHGLLLGFVFPALPANLLATAHRLIDTRAPLHWWQRVFKQTTVGGGGDIGLHVSIWEDQTFHIACIALAALLCGKRR